MVDSHRQHVVIHDLLCSMDAQWCPDYVSCRSWDFQMGPFRNGLVDRHPSSDRCGLPTSTWRRDRSVGGKARQYCVAADHGGADVSAGVLQYLLAVLLCKSGLRPCGVELCRGDCLYICVVPQASSRNGPWHLRGWQRGSGIDRADCPVSARGVHRRGRKPGWMDGDGFRGSMPAYWS